MFRRSRGTDLLQSGVDVATAAMILGNTPAVLLNAYVHPTPEHVRKAIEGRK